MQMQLGSCWDDYFLCGLESFATSGDFLRGLISEPNTSKHVSKLESTIRMMLEHFGLVMCLSMEASVRRSGNLSGHLPCIYRSSYAYAYAYAHAYAYAYAYAHAYAYAYYAYAYV